VLRAQEARVLGVEVAEQHRAPALRLRQHAFRTAAVQEARARQVPPDEAEARGLEPEVPVLEAGAHPLVEAQPPVHQLAPHQAAGVAVVLGQQHEQGKVAAGGEVLRPADLVDVGVEPAHLRRRRLQRREGAGQEARVQAVVGVQAEQRAQGREGGERELDAGVARGGQAAVRPPQREHPARVRRGHRKGRARCLGIGAAVVHDHRGGGRAALLHQHGADRFRQQARLAVGRDDDGDEHRRGWKVAALPGRAWVSVGRECSPGIRPPASANAGPAAVHAHRRPGRGHGPQVGR
jgi:hypothetical protein